MSKHHTNISNEKWSYWTTSLAEVVGEGLPFSRRFLQESFEQIQNNVVTKVKQVATQVPTRDHDDGIHNVYGYGIMCGESLCEHCCLVESGVCGTTFECN